MQSFASAIPLSLYVHLPWCLKKCPYCDFNSHESRTQELPEQRYVDALLTDLEEELPRVWGRRPLSLFIGGGTPSLFSPEALERLLSGLKARLAMGPHTEITLEANPGTFEQARFSEFRAIGINRLSIGVQSFDDAPLKRLGRIHDGAEALRAVEIAHQAGFDNINLDLMFALPDQGPAQSRQDLQTAIALAPAHISFYQLTLEPNTAFHHAPPTLPDEDTQATMHSAGQDLLGEAGYGQYEVSAYAREGMQCRHNLNYWEFGDYLGLGAGAHGKLTDMHAARITRRCKQRQPEHYMQACEQHAGASDEQTLDEAQTAFEFMLNALRLNRGFDNTLFTQRTGLDLALIEEPLQHAVERGLLEHGAQHTRPTTLGRRFLNDLTGMFLPEGGYGT